MAISEEDKKLISAVFDLTNKMEGWSVRVSNDIGKLFDSQKDTQGEIKKINSELVIISGKLNEADWRLKNGAKHFEELDRQNDIFDKRIVDIEKDFRLDRCDKHSGVIETLKENFWFNKGKWWMLASMFASMGTFIGMIYMMFRIINMVKGG